MQLDKNFDSNSYEDLIYALWEKNQVFQAQPDSQKERFSMIMPPPNETGTLGVHHVLFLTLQDILARYNRMRGKDVLWLPGTDHAALAVNAIIEKQLAKEGLSKHDIGRERFLMKTREFVNQSRGTMIQQMRSVGAGADWTRLRYTLEDTSVRVVNETFIKMYRQGLIYRGDRIINWDPVLETTVSDDEVSYRNEKTTLYYFRLGPFEISTVRPETKFGDKYIVVNPNDQRYKDYNDGQVIEVEWINGLMKLTVIKDDLVDPNFGSGAMTITPWHSLIDYEIAKKHHLDYEQVIDYKGKLLPIAGEFAGLSIDQARPKIIDKLRQKGLLIKEDKNYYHKIAFNSRSDAIIEPQIMRQWFVDVNKKAVIWHGKQLSFKEILQQVIVNQEIKIIPKRFEKIYFNWINNLQDWCISRQIWWGHRIPAWYRDDVNGQEVYVGLRPPQDDKEGFHQWVQDPDTLDTWFSSALWTFSTLIDPSKAENLDLSFEDLLKQSVDFQTYHPTDVLETGWDIIFFWVARMILATTFMTGQIPFKTVYLHGLVRSSDGKKMSKSRPESLIDPLEVIKKYGADALRIGIVMGVSPGGDLIYSDEKTKSGRNFANKLWNIARYIENFLNQNLVSKKQDQSLTLIDKWLLYNLNQIQKKYFQLIESYKFAEAYDLIYQFVWHDYADWYIESSKIMPNYNVLRDSFRIILQLVHPFAPFVSESIWQILFSQDDDLLANQIFSSIKIKSDYRQASQEFDQIRKIITETRTIIKNTESENLTLYFKPSKIIRDNTRLISKLAKLKNCLEVESGNGWPLTSTELDCWLDIESAVISKYLSTLQNKLDSYHYQLQNLYQRLNNPDYLKKAPKHIINQTRLNIADLENSIKSLEIEISRFN